MPAYYLINKRKQKNENKCNIPLEKTVQVLYRGHSDGSLEQRKPANLAANGFRCCYSYLKE